MLIVALLDIVTGHHASGSAMLLGPPEAVVLLVN